MMTERIKNVNLINKDQLSSVDSRNDSPTSILKKKVSFKFTENLEDFGTADSN